MQQLAICHTLESSNFSLTLEIAEQYYRGSDPHNKDEDIVEQDYRCSNPHKVDRHITSPEEAEVPERHNDPQSYVAAVHGYVIYWL